MRFLGLALFFVLAAPAAFAVSDPLPTTKLTVAGPDAGQAVDRTVADLRKVFQNFVPALDSSTKIVKPLKVSGTANEPVVTVSLQKCVAIVCETVDLDGTATIRETSGNCTQNYVLRVDLSRSSALLSNLYDELDADVCFTAGSGGAGTILLSPSVHEARGYSRGFIQGEVLGMLQLQIAPITSAIQKVLQANGDPSDPTP